MSDGYYAHETVSSSPVEENYSNYGHIQMLDEDIPDAEENLLHGKLEKDIEDKINGDDVNMNSMRKSFTGNGASPVVRQHEPMYQRLPHINHSSPRYNQSRVQSPQQSHPHQHQRRPLAAFGQNYCNLDCCKDSATLKRRSNGLYEKNLNNNRNFPQQRQHLSLPRHLHRSTIANDSNNLYSNASEHYFNGRNGRLSAYIEPEVNDQQSYPVTHCAEDENHLFNGYEGELNNNNF